MHDLPKLLGVLIAALALLPLARTPARAGSALAVIVSQASPAKAISVGDLRRVFLSEPVEYAPGKRFIPINHPPEHATRQSFDRTLLGLTPVQAGALWVDRRIRDQPAPPRSVPDALVITRVVIALPGAISYVPVELVTPKVRALMVDGKAPGQPGYLFAN